MARSNKNSFLGAIFSAGLGVALLMTVPVWTPYWVGLWQGVAEVFLKTL